MSGNSESVTMIEKVARALCSMQGSPPLNPDHIYKGRPIWQEWEHEARAAIEAMREPTEAMVLAAEKSGTYWHHDVSETAEEWRAEMRIEWQTMIDTALSEDEG